MKTYILTTETKNLFTMPTKDINGVYDSPEKAVAGMLQLMERMEWTDDVITMKEHSDIYISNLKEDGSISFSVTSNIILVIFAQDMNITVTC